MNPQRRAIRQAERLALIVGWLKPCRTYVWIPQALIDRLRAYPLAVGLYVVYARLWMAWTGSGGVPVSDADLSRLFPTFCHGSILAARQYLLDGGWLIKTRCGNKNTYIPTWGYDRDGQLRPWTREKGFNRQSAKTVRFNRDILDFHVGRLLPDPAKPATVERYVANPLSLRAVGIAAIALRSHTVTDEQAIAELESHRLMHDGELLAAPSPTETLAQLERSDRGTRRLAQWMGDPALAPLNPVPESRGPMSPATFFFGTGLIMLLLNLLLNRITGGSDGDVAPEAEIPVQPWEAWYPTGMTGILTVKGNPPARSQKNQQGGGEIVHPRYDYQPISEPTTDLNPNGSSIPSAQTARRGRRNVMSIPNTPTALALRAIRVRPNQICELAEMDAEVVTAVIADAQSRPLVQDVAGWTVTVLRDMRDHSWQHVALPRDPFAAFDAPDPAWDVTRAKAEAWLAERGMLPVDGGSEAKSTPAPTGAATTPMPDVVPIVRAEPAPEESTPAPVGAVTTPAPADDAARPDWLPLDVWWTLEDAARHALAFAARDTDRIYARDVWRQGYMDDHPALVAALLALPA